MELLTPQRHFGARLFFAAVVCIFLIQILAIDMYVPALPTMQEEFAVSVSTLNSTVFVFLIVQTIATVIAGPLADRFGRRPVLSIGCGLFTIGSLGCALVGDVGSLSVARAIQALGLGSTATVTSAMIKDSFGGHDLKKSMTLLQSLIIIGPIFAPFLGSALIVAIGWRGIFLALFLGGLGTIGLALAIDETYHPDASATLGIATTLKTMAQTSLHLLKSRGFSTLALFVGVTGIPFFAYIALSSYIMLDEFALGYLDYAIFYGVACAVNCLAPFGYLGLSRFLNTRTILLLCLGLTGISWFVFMGLSPTPWVFLLGFLPYAFAEGLARPASYLVLLDQPPAIVGTASAFANSAYGLITALATVAATLPWPTFFGGLCAMLGIAFMLSAVLFCLGHRQWKDPVP